MIEPQNQYIVLNQYIRYNLSAFLIKVKVKQKVVSKNFF